MLKPYQVGKICKILEKLIDREMKSKKEERKRGKTEKGRKKVKEKGREWWIQDFPGEEGANLLFGKILRETA